MFIVVASKPKKSLGWMLLIKHVKYTNLHIITKMVQK